MKERFDVTGMTCSACSSHVEKSVGKLTGVENVSVNLLTNSMQVEFDENKLDTAGIIKAVEDAGYGAAVKDEHAKSGAKTSGQSDSQENSGLSAVFNKKEKFRRKHEKETDRLTDFLDTVDVCVHGTYDISVAQHSDAAVYHELSAWK